MAVETYGVTATELAAYFPTVGFAATAPLPPARVTVLVDQVSAVLNGILIHASGSTSIITTIAADTSAEAYKNMQRLVCSQCAPAVYAGAHSAHGSAEHRSLVDMAREELRAFRSNPRSIGITSAGIIPEVRTSTDGHDIDPATAAAARTYDDVGTGGSFTW